ncbi:MAG: hypothetical protein KH044_03000 [Veillonella sp.]|uniref:hypothetical protein n=1 Tax=Veillonella sp. TaxID=1926307 RepID=UPI00257F7D8F|nr:hypothetical protein [Veillonella sp.]MBS7163965.1 hypothetical protein [Veillonella sp.]
MTKNSSNHLKSIHKLNESIRKSMYPPVMTSLYESQLQLRQEYDDYISEINAYKATAFNLNDKEINDILLSIANGKNSFNDLCTVINGLNSATIMKYLLDKPKMRVNSPTGLNLLGDNIISTSNQKVYLQLQSIPDDFYAPYEFNPDEEFMLTISGENRLFEIQKELDEKDSRNKSLDIANQSLKSSKMANTLSVVAIILAIISIFISILFKFF